MRKSRAEFRFGRSANLLPIFRGPHSPLQRTRGSVKCSLQATITPTMSTLWTLCYLYSLDTSSPDFLRRLHSLFRYDEEEQYLSNLQGPGLARLLDFLDHVRTHSSAFRQLRNRSRRPSVPFPPTAIFLENVSTSYKPSVATA